MKPFVENPVDDEIKCILKMAQTRLTWFGKKIKHDYIPTENTDYIEFKVGPKCHGFPLKYLIVLSCK